MSEITDQIQSYRGGKIDFETLKGRLVDRTYPAPERYLNRPSDPYELEKWLEDVAPDYSEGTWDEVSKAWATGLLTDQEYEQISRAYDGAHQAPLV